MLQNTFRRRGPAALAVLVVASSLVGCGAETDEIPREAISGTVTLDGQPLEKGTIEFTPADPSAGRPATGEVVAGAFDIPADQGPPPGAYVVRVNSMEELPAKPGADPSVPDMRIPRNRVSPLFNARSTLSAEVKAGEPNTYEFAVKSAKSK